MSYILDALKKAETERHLGELPGLHTQSLGGLKQPSRAGLWQRPSTWVVLSIALAGMLALTWQLSLRLDTPAVVESPPALPVAVAVTPTPATAIVVANDLSVPPPILRALPKPRAEALPKSQPDAPPAPTIATKSVPVVAPLSAAAPVETGRIVTLAQLPDTLQHELPPLAIGGSMYSDSPTDRMLLIDKRLFHEGDEVAPGLVLENLMPKAAVLRYKGYRFRIAF